MSFAAKRAVLCLALLTGCAQPQRMAPAAGPEETAISAAELSRMRCLVVAPFESTSDLPRLGEVATSALASSLDPELTRVFPVEDLRRLFRGTSLELPPDGVSSRQALALAEKVRADGVLYGAVEGRAQGAAGFVVTVRLLSTAGRELLFASDAQVKLGEGEQVEVALRRGLLLAARPMLLKIGAQGSRACFDPEIVQRARVLRAAPAATAADPPAPEPAAGPLPAPSVPIPTPPASSPEVAAQPAVAEAPIVVRKVDPQGARQAEVEHKLREGTRFVLEDVEFAGRTAVLSQEQGLVDLSRALAALPMTSIRIEVFVDATQDPSLDTRAAMAQAMAVVRKLVALGVARERIAQEALGGVQPVLPNFTARGRAANRRVEVVPVRSR